MNRIELIGNLGRDPEIKSFDTGKKMMRFSLATAGNFKPKDGTDPKTNWHTVIVWGKVAEYLEGRLRKGSRVFVIGEMESRTYEGKDGETKYAFEVRADIVYVL